MSDVLTISQVNELNYEDFIGRFGNVIEHCSICAAAVWRFRPFHDIRHLHQAICSFLDLLPNTGKEGVLRLHPDLAGRLAELGSLTQESSAEQKAAGLDTMTPEEKQLLKDTNSKYRDKFGFPFVICARQNKKEAILKGIVERLEHSAAEELNIGIEEVKKICMLRLLSIVPDEQ
ncbi:2-oxo-4-hydroxy-4-carboxy-5-ureidoimidazoline decarboxylase [Daphnia magna]|uniref:2-oxo-4-hydroxy-4-carboxy-5-ureidoimidazoline decarboxylase n=2 Tax=Daphnia magna TaxID=35525 RepID=A0A0P4XF24_9CRUS|nr:2-oxo-4-hydroxy-4-carboxy-5-ureidoimidazoline decarboxylase [Daphnia magna]